jgi:hypothetical protein
MLGQTSMKSMPGETHSRHCSWLMFRVSFAHSTSGQTGGPGHSRTVPSALAEAIRFPSGLNATLTTLFLCPISGSPIGRPVGRGAGQSPRPTAQLVNRVVHDRGGFGTPSPRGVSGEPASRKPCWHGSAQFPRRRNMELPD